MAFSKFDFDVITDPGVQRERVAWIPLRRPELGREAAEEPKPGVEAGETRQASG